MKAPRKVLHSKNLHAKVCELEKNFFSNRSATCLSEEILILSRLIVKSFGPYLVWDMFERREAGEVGVQTDPGAQAFKKLTALHDEAVLRHLGHSVGITYSRYQ